MSSLPPMSLGMARWRVKREEAELCLELRTEGGGKEGSRWGLGVGHLPDAISASNSNSTSRLRAVMSLALVPVKVVEWSVARAHVWGQRGRRGESHLLKRA